jgi:copper chaperone CopZ
VTREKKTEANMEKVTLSIPSIHCNHCVMTIRRESGLVQGVEFVSGDPQQKTATFNVEGREALEALKRALAEAGYPAE